MTNQETGTRDRQVEMLLVKAYPADVCHHEERGHAAVYEGAEVDRGPLVRNREAAVKEISENISVLLIEDNPGDARLVKEALKGISNPAYEVEWVDRLSVGLSRLTDGGIDVLLLDLGLPDSEGLSALALIRAVAPAVPVVVLSGTAFEQFAVDAVQAGAQDYIVKMYANGYLLTRSLRYAIERKRGEEALRESEERWRLAMRAANEAIWEYDPVSGSVRWNETYGQEFDRPAGGGSSSQWWIQHIHPDDAGRAAKSFERALSGHGDSWVEEYRLQRPDGSWADIYDRAFIARDASGRPVRVVGAMLDITERKRGEEALRQSNGKLQQLSRDLLRTQDYERRRIARELHDSTAQLLAALSINLSRLQDPWLEANRRWQALSEARELAAACATEIRTVTYLLHPPLLDEIGLVAALRAYILGFSQRTGIQVEIKAAPELGRLSGELEATLFRIAQEGLANVHKHSGSPLAAIRLERGPQEVRLVLQDRGRGLPEELNGKQEGFARFGVGIMGMRERAEQLGGRLELASNGVGTKLTVTLPLVQSNEENTNTVGR